MAGKEFIVPVQKRDTFGTSAARRMRRDGLVPLVVYSHGDAPESLALSEPEADRLSTHTGMVGLAVEGEKERVNAIVRDIQVHPLTQRVLHIDCLGVRADEEITVNVPLEAVGEPKGASEGGLLDQQHFEVQVTCLPGNVPESIQLDVSDLAVGDSLSIADIPPHEGLVFEDDPESVLFTVAIPKEEPEEEEGEEGEEGVEEPELVGAKKEGEGEGGEGEE